MSSFFRFSLTVGGVVLLCSTLVACGADSGSDEAAAEPTYPLSVSESDTHRFEEYAPGVYFAVGTGSLFVQSNAMVIVNEEDVVVVDSHVSGAAGKALLESISVLTDKPVRYLINTHYHFDHAHGNQAFADDVVIVGHEFTRQKLLGNVLEEATYKLWTGGLPAAVEQMRSSLEDVTDEKEREALELQIAVQAAHVEALGEVVPTPPTVTLSKSLTLRRGERSIEIRFLGKGHTGGDVVVLLPDDGVVFTGDLLVPGPSYMGDGYAGDWVETLDRLKELDFEWILPGHGEATRDREIIDVFQGVLGSLWSQVAAAKQEGKTAAEAADAIDFLELLSPYPDNAFVALDPETRRAVHQRQVSRAYEVFEEGAE